LSDRTVTFFAWRCLKRSGRRDVAMVPKPIITIDLLSNMFLSNIEIVFSSVNIIYIVSNYFNFRKRDPRLCGAGLWMMEEGSFSLKSLTPFPK
jgi:hypothetical protein